MALYAIIMIASLQADSAMISGQAYSVPKNKVTQIPGLFKSSNRAAPACPPPLPNLPEFAAAPLPNPTPVPGAFFPNPSASNKLLPPPQTIDFTFIAGKTGIDPEFQGTPPDPFGQKGLTQYVLGGNLGYVSFNGNGIRDNVLDTENQTLSNLDGDFTLFISNRDGRIHYDRLANRFICVNLTGDSTVGTNGYFGFTLAVSDSGTLTKDTQWTVFSVFDPSMIPDNNGCPGDLTTSLTLGPIYDYPCVGIDQNAIYLTFRISTNTTGANLSSTLFIFNKESLYNGDGPALINVFRDFVKEPDGSFVPDQEVYRLNPAVFPLNNFDDPNPTFGYLVSADPIFYGKLNLFRVLGAGTTSPSLVGPFAINTMQLFYKLQDTISYSPFLGQLYGILGLIESANFLADSSHLNKKQIYTAQIALVDNNGISSASGDRIGIQWYQLDVTGDPTGQGLGIETATTIPALVQAGTLFDTAISNPLYYSFPTIMTNSQGDISLAGCVMGVNQPPSAFFVGKAGTDAKDGTLNIGTVPPNVYAVGTGHFTRSVGSNPTAFIPTPQLFAQRWGDMSYSCVDPVDNKTIWTIAQICQDGCETQVVAKLLAP